VEMYNGNVEKKYHPREMILSDPNPRAMRVEYTTLSLVYSYS
jgi:hypothetical protein